MTRRDDFAKAALTGLLANPDRGPNDCLFAWDPKGAAQHVVEHVDALIAELDRTKEKGMEKDGEAHSGSPEGEPEEDASETCQGCIGMGTVEDFDEDEPTEVACGVVRRERQVPAEGRAGGGHPMSDPKTRALELVDELEHEAMGSDSYDSGTAIALRRAIAQIPTTSWQPMARVERPTKERPIILLLKDRSQFVANEASPLLQKFFALYGHVDGASRCVYAEDALAWRPADSTELPEDWGTE